MIGFWVFALEHTCQFVGFFMLWLRKKIWCYGIPMLWHFYVVTFSKGSCARKNKFVAILMNWSNEPRHDKTNKMSVHPVKTHISLSIRPVRSASLLSAWRKLGSLATHWAQSEDSDQTGWMPRLIWFFTGRICHFVGFVMRQLKW